MDPAGVIQIDEVAGIAVLVMNRARALGTVRLPRQFAGGQNGLAAPQKSRKFGR
jgi:hypothetical protein